MPRYFDTSAMVPLLLAEPSSAHCASLWEQADIIVTSSLSRVELHAAVARASRLGRIAAVGPGQLRADIEQLWDDVAPIPPTEEILDAAARLASEHGLRGYDAVQCASALAVASDDLVAISGDRDLLRAWQALGIAIVDIG